MVTISRIRSHANALKPTGYDAYLTRETTSFSDAGHVTVVGNSTAFDVSDSTQAILPAEILAMTGQLDSIYSPSRPSYQYVTAQPPLYARGFSRMGVGTVMGWGGLELTCHDNDTRADVFDAFLAPSISGLFDQLDRWSALSEDDWAADDSDPMTKAAISTTRRLLQVLSSVALGCFLHHGRRPQLELVASRDGGTGIILATRTQEFEFTVDPDGSVSLLIVNLEESDPDLRYVERGALPVNNAVEEIGALLA